MSKDIIGEGRLFSNPELIPALLTEWTKQAKKLALLFAERLGMPEQEYIGSLPPFGSQPEGMKEKLRPVIVQPPIPGKLSLEEIIEIAGIDQRGFTIKLPNTTQAIIDWREDPKKFRTPTKPYTTWLTYRGTHELGNTQFVRLKVVLESGNHLRCGTISDGIALYLANPEAFIDREIVLPGSEWIPQSVLRDTVVPSIVYRPNYSPKPHISLKATTDTTLNLPSTLIALRTIVTK